MIIIIANDERRRRRGGGAKSKRATTAGRPTPPSQPATTTPPLAAGAATITATASRPTSAAEVGWPSRHVLRPVRPHVRPVRPVSLRRPAWTRAAAQRTDGRTGEAGWKKDCGDGASCGTQVRGRHRPPPAKERHKFRRRRGLCRKRISFSLGHHRSRGARMATAARRDVSWTKSSQSWQVGGQVRPRLGRKEMGSSFTSRTAHAAFGGRVQCRAGMLREGRG